MVNTNSPASRLTGLFACVLVLAWAAEAAGQPELKFTLEHSYVLDVGSPAFTPEGKRIFTAGLSVKVFWDAATGKEVQKWETKSWRDENPVFSRSGKAVYLWGAKEVVGYEVATGKLLGQVELALDLSKRETWKSITSVAVTTDDQLVIAGTHGDKVCFWDLATGNTRELPAYPAEVVDARLSPDGKRVFATHLKGVEGRFRLSEVAGGKVLYDGPSIEQCERALGFSPDGRTFAFDGRRGLADEHQIRLIDPETGKVKADLRGHKGYIMSLAFSADGKYVATGSADKTARIWDAATGRSWAELRPGGQVRRVQFSPDGRRLVTGSDEPRGTIKVWDLNLPKSR
jgi:WD40 repeat protein